MIAIFVATFMIIAVILPVGLYFISKSRTKQILEDSRFTVKKLDIVDSTVSSLTINGSLSVEGLEQKDVEKISLETIHIRLYNNTKDISSFDLPIDVGNIQEEVNFEVEIEIDTEDPEEIILDVISYILFGDNFFIEFEGTIQYKGLGISDQLTFNNRLYFILDQNPISIYLEKILLPSDPSFNPNISYTIFNPFSLGAVISGDIDIVLVNRFMGEINLDPTLINSGYTELESTLIINSSYFEFFSHYLDNFNTDIQLFSNISLQIDEFYIEIDPTVELEAEEFSISMNITQINELSIDFDRLILDISANITTDLPMQVNLTAFYADIYSTNNEKMGSIWFESNYTIPLGLIPVTLENIIVNASTAYLDTITTDLLEGSVYMRNIELGMQLFDNNNIYQVEDSVFTIS